MISWYHDKQQADHPVPSRVILRRRFALSLHEEDRQFGVPQGSLVERTRVCERSGTRPPPSWHLGCGSSPRYATNHRLLRSEEHTSELQSLMRISYAVFRL